MKPDWITDKNTRVFAIPKGAIGEGNIVKGAVRSENNKELIYRLEEWREAWERSTSAPAGAYGGPRRTLPDGHVWLVKRECERCEGTYFGCGGCNETGYVHDLVPEDAEEVRAYGFVLAYWQDHGNPSGWMFVKEKIGVNPEDIDGLRFVSGDGTKRHDKWKEKG